MKKTIALMLIGVLTAGMLVGCGNKPQEAPEEAVVPEVVDVVEDTTEVEEEPVALAEPGINDLTGEHMDEELAAQRPVAVMYGNTADACPNYGISDADVVYEATVEGGITRLMGIFQDYESVEKIMSIRSCRYYYIDWALEFDAIYCHYGQEESATEVLDRDYVDDLNGLDGDLAEVTFFRDDNRVAPHNAYTSGTGLSDGIALREFETKHSDDYQKHYNFAADGETVTLDGDDCDYVKINDFSVDTPWFEYDEESQSYLRFQYGSAQIDGLTDENLYFKNVLIQENEWSLMDPENTEHPYLNMETIGDGTGYYLTNGKVIKITWKKESQTAPTRYFNEAGEEITMNQGKTFVCVVKDINNISFDPNASYDAPVVDNVTETEDGTIVVQ